MMNEEQFEAFAHRHAILTNNTRTAAEIVAKGRSVVRTTKFRSLPRATQDQYRPTLNSGKANAALIEALDQVDDMLAGRRSTAPRRTQVEVVARANDRPATTPNRQRRDQARRRQAAKAKSAA